MLATAAPTREATTRLHTRARIPSGLLRSKRSRSRWQPALQCGGTGCPELLRPFGPWCNTWVADRASPGHAWSVGESNPCVRTTQLPAETPRMEQVGFEPTSAGCASRLARLRFRICPERRCPIRAGFSDPTTLASSATAVKVPPSLAMWTHGPPKLVSRQPEKVIGLQTARCPASVGCNP